MHKPLSGLTLVLGVIFTFAGGFSVLTPRTELNGINPQAATKGAALLLFTGLATLTVLFFIDKYKPKTSYLLVLFICSASLALVSVAFLLQGD